MAPKPKLPKTITDAHKVGLQSIKNLFSAKRMPGRPMKSTPETIKELVKQQATATALEEQRHPRGRPRRDLQKVSVILCGSTVGRDYFGWSKTANGGLVLLD